MTTFTESEVLFLQSRGNEVSCPLVDCLQAVVAFSAGELRLKIKTLQFSFLGKFLYFSM